MSTLPRPEAPPLAPGMLALVLGTVGLMLFFLPILGVPLSAFALLVGLIATGLAAFRAGGSLRYALLGSAMAALALGVNLAVLYAPGSELPHPGVPPPWQPVPDRPYAPPPSLPMYDPAGK
ncbi:MAG TPA: hypothetical protein VFW33_06365 [Gemmataceae bacterium]|nr:hypothetical protein [Gemmataceae bacterium]